MHWLKEKYRSKAVKISRFSLSLDKHVARAQQREIFSSLHMQKNREGKKETVTKEVMPINLKLSTEYFPHDHLSFQ